MKILLTPETLDEFENSWREYLERLKNAGYIRNYQILNSYETEQGFELKYLCRLQCGSLRELTLNSFEKIREPFYESTETDF